MRFSREPTTGLAAYLARGLVRFSLASVICFSALPVGAEEAGSPFLYCTTCHGADGSGNIRIGAPKISGMEDWYIRNQFRSFLKGWRGEHVLDDGGAEMVAIARILSQPEDLEAAIEYVDSLDSSLPPVTITGNTENGRGLYRTCAACHGDQGEGSETLNAPALTGQSDWYLVKTLNDYRNDIRGGHADDVLGAQMKATVSLLRDDTDINDVVAYISTLGSKQD